MPIKDPIKRRAYQRELMRKKRKQGLTKNVSPEVSSEIVSPVRPKNKLLDPGLTVRPTERVLDPVRPCQLNHITLTELFHQAQEQVKTSWQEIINRGGVNQCHNCHNSQNNHQLTINLLEKY